MNEKKMKHEKIVKALVSAEEHYQVDDQYKQISLKDSLVNCNNEQCHGLFNMKKRIQGQKLPCLNLPIQVPSRQNYRQILK